MRAVAGPGRLARAAGGLWHRPWQPVGAAARVRPVPQPGPFREHVAQDAQGRPRPQPHQVAAALMPACPWRRRAGQASLHAAAASGAKLLREAVVSMCDALVGDHRMRWGARRQGRGLVGPRCALARQVAAAIVPDGNPSCKSPAAASVTAGCWCQPSSLHAAVPGPRQVAEPSDGSELRRHSGCRRRPCTAPALSRFGCKDDEVARVLGQHRATEATRGQQQQQRQ